MNTWGDKRTDQQERLDAMARTEERFNAEHFGQRFLSVDDILGPPVELPPPEVPDYTRIGKTPMHVYGPNRRCERCENLLTKWSQFTLCNRVEIDEILDADTVRRLFDEAMTDSLKDYGGW